MAKKPLTNQCPYCDLSMSVSQMACPSCNVIVAGDFPSSRLSQLPIEHQRFIEMFVLASGSLKEIATRTGVSYPTVRSRLDKVIDALRTEISKTVPNSGTILDAVVEGSDDKSVPLSRTGSRKQQKQEQIETASKLIKSI
ncbi:MAG: DUF2089 family protein [Planctomycetota bacterium]